MSNSSKPKLLADASLPNLTLFEQHFDISVFHDEMSLKSHIQTHDSLLCRSTISIHQDLLQHSHLQCIATASSGTDHIDESYLTQQGIKLIDAKGCNAESVADYVLSTLAYLILHHQRIDNTVGIIGLGHVGSCINQRLHALGYHTLCYDPLKQLHDKSFQSCSLQDLASCSILLIHANLHNNAPYPSINLVDGDFLDRLAPGCIIINAARGGIVNEEAVLERSNHLIYCADVYLNEPNIDKRLIQVATIATPHVAGHSIDAKSKIIEKIHSELLTHFKLVEANTSVTAALTKHVQNPNANWAERFLAGYNPIHETQALKQATDKTQAFLTLRKAHHRNSLARLME